MAWNPLKLWSYEDALQDYHHDKSPRQLDREMAEVQAEEMKRRGNNLTVTDQQFHQMALRNARARQN